MFGIECMVRGGGGGVLRVLCWSQGSKGAYAGTKDGLRGGSLDELGAGALRAGSQSWGFTRWETELGLYALGARAGALRAGSQSWGFTRWDPELGLYTLGSRAGALRASSQSLGFTR